MSTQPAQAVMEPAQARLSGGGFVAPLIRIVVTLAAVVTVSVAAVAEPDNTLSPEEAVQKIAQIEQAMPAVAQSALKRLVATAPQGVVFNGAEVQVLGWTRPAPLSRYEFGDALRMSALARSSTGQNFIVGFQVGLARPLLCSQSPDQCIVNTGVQLVSAEQAKQWLAENEHSASPEVERNAGHKAGDGVS